MRKIIFGTIVVALVALIWILPMPAYKSKSYPESSLPSKETTQAYEPMAHNEIERDRAMVQDIAPEEEIFDEAEEDVALDDDISVDGDSMLGGLKAQVSNKIEKRKADARRPSVTGALQQQASKSAAKTGYNMPMPESVMPKPVQQLGRRAMYFQEAQGYWQNTYIPGDPVLQQLQQRLDIPANRQQNRLAQTVKPVWQPFDVPQYAALGLYLQADTPSVQNNQRLRLQIGIKGSARHSSQRPAMNVALVIACQNIAANAQKLRALLMAFSKARQVGDQFSLTIAHDTVETLIQPGKYKYGAVTLALQSILQNTKQHYHLKTLAAMKQANQLLKQYDDPTAALGSSLLLLITDHDLNAQELQSFAHHSATNGIPVSVVSMANQIKARGLESIVLAGQGHRRLLKDAAQADALVNRELSAVSKVVARAIRLRIRLAPHVKLINILGSKRLDKKQSSQVREMEQSLDQRLARNLGIQPDRGKDEEGIQIVIPAFYANDEHVILLDVVAEHAGSMLDVNVRYKDLVYLKNNVVYANLSLSSQTLASGPLQHNVMKNVLAWQLSETLRKASQQNKTFALQQLQSFQTKLAKYQQAEPWFQDIELSQDQHILTQYIQALQRSHSASQRQNWQDSLQYASFRKLLSQPIP